MVSSAGIPLFLFRRLAVWTLRWMVAVQSSKRFSSKLKVWYLAGQIANLTARDTRQSDNKCHLMRTFQRRKGSTGHPRMMQP